MKYEPMKNTGEIIKKIESAINHRLKIVLKDGKKLLNTKNTNYSYGTLVDVLEYGLDLIPIQEVSSVLLLGMGGGSIIQSLREKYEINAPITAVEIDPVVVDIAKDIFKISDDSNVEIVCQDAWDFVQKSTQKFDLAIVDIFIDVHVPEKFYLPEFWQMLDESINPHGFVLFNAGIDMKQTEVQKFVAQLPDNFVYQKNYYVLESNTVIIMQKIF